MSVLLVGVTLAVMFGPLRDQRWEQPQLLFGLVVIAAGAGVAAATTVMAIADRREMAEIGLLGSALMAASVLPLVHGLATPGVLYGETEAFRSAAYLPDRGPCSSRDTRRRRPRTPGRS